VTGQKKPPEERTRQAPAQRRSTRSDALRRKVLQRAGLIVEQARLVQLEEAGLSQLAERQCEALAELADTVKAKVKQAHTPPGLRARRVDAPGVSVQPDPGPSGRPPSQQSPDARSRRKQLDRSSERKGRIEEYRVQLERVRQQEAERSRDRENEGLER
jgi:hypothetical protein